MLKYIKVSIFIFLVLCYFVTTVPFLPFFFIAPMPTRKVLNRIVQIYCKIAIKVFGVKVQVDGLEKIQGPTLIVGNHLSYIDILVLSSIYPSSYVTSIEVKHTPVLGQIVILAGCLFVERRNRDNLQNEIKDITNALKSGLNVTIFPEATSTNGEAVIRFRKPLYNAAKFSNTHITPICLNYTHVNGKKISTQTRDSVCWYDDMTFFPHLMDFSSLRSLNVSVKVLSPITNQSVQDKEALELAQTTHSAISEHYAPIM